MRHLALFLVAFAAANPGKDGRVPDASGWGRGEADAGRHARDQRSCAGRSGAEARCTGGAKGTDSTGCPEPLPARRNAKLPLAPGKTPPP
jgi:hypothetical protein